MPSDTVWSSFCLAEFAEFEPGSFCLFDTISFASYIDSSWLSYSSTVTIRRGMDGFALGFGGIKVSLSDLYSNFY